MFSSPFQTDVFVPPDAEVIFVADLFSNEYPGGAELTTDAVIQKATCKVASVNSRNLTLSLLEQHATKYWVFGNFSQLNFQLIPTITANLRYSVVEYDYKYCKHRSPEKHKAIEMQHCCCHDEVIGKLVSAFYYGADALFWMSEAQKNRYHDLFPFLQEKQNVVLSSVFDESTLDEIVSLQSKEKTERWLVLGSDSWIKGTKQAIERCKQLNVQFDVAKDIPYSQLLSKLATSKGFVYLPEGGDTCPRMVIEAKLLGCELVINENVQHANETWFNTPTVEILDYLRKRATVFWDVLTRFKNKKFTISGYTTTYNCVSQGYPFEQSIQSMLEFCDEVCVVDGGSTDGTRRRLFEFAKANAEKPWSNELEKDAFAFFAEQPDETLQDLLLYESMKHCKCSFDIKGSKKLVIKIFPRDWNDLRSAVFDGMQKAEARKLCTGDFCWQMDVDEVVHEDHYGPIHELVKTFPKGVNLLSLPVVEYWGGYDKIRLDINPWKWRLSRNLPSITHGIPKNLRRTDENGRLFAAMGTDGCDMIDALSFEPIPNLGFYTQEAHQTRLAALQGNKTAMMAYQEWFETVVQNVPGVFHFSWFDIERKIKTYSGYWARHWKSLYDKTIEDTPENNMMFDKRWADVTDDDMKVLAARLKNETGGWVWHRKWHGQCLPHLTLSKPPPRVTKGFYGGNATTPPGSSEEES